MHPIALIVIAKEPLPGKAKTRLTPPCTPLQAAELAGAALADTLDAVAGARAARRVLVFDGDPRRWRRRGFEVIAQRRGGLADRLAGAFSDVAGPALLIGMDTPQLTPELLDDGLRALARPGTDAVLGPAADGGYWSIGLRRNHADTFAGVPMSRDDTCRHQRARLHELSLNVHEQASLRDVDTIADAHAVARTAPSSRFAAALRAITA